ncbi:MAG: DUF3124 domain-containing protein [Methylotetracoccus sp.]|jgi:hypothetical protein|nr:DUF3124 domain-containing protein [Methylotetracoccus sp.]
MSKSLRLLTQVLVVAAVLSLPWRLAGGEPATARGQLLFVPVYSELAYGDRKHTLNLSATLTIRNTDRKNPLSLTRVDYYSSQGMLLRSYLKKPQSISPMASVEYIISGADRTGGTAASFLVEWESASPMSVPVVEAVMISAASMYGVSFQSVAQVLEETR